MSDDVPPHPTSPVVVTTDDGTVLSCAPVDMGGHRFRPDIRWKLLDPEGLLHIGPVYVADQSPEDLQRLVSAWWESRKVSGHADKEAPEPPPSIIREMDPGT